MLKGTGLLCSIKLCLNRPRFKLTLEMVQWRLHLTQVEYPELQPLMTKFFTVSKKVLFIFEQQLVLGALHGIYRQSPIFL